MVGNPKPAPPKRRILLIERAFQLRFIGKVTAVVVLGTVLTGGLLYLLADKEFGRAFYSAHYQARSSWELLLPAVLISSFASMCLVASLAVFLTLYDSHRIGGPLYRFRANLETLSRGDLTLITRLRDGDELQSLTEAMNAMTESLADKVKTVKDAEAALEESLNRLLVLPEAESCRAVLVEVLAAKGKLAEALNVFRVSR